MNKIKTPANKLIFSIITVVTIIVAIAGMILLTQAITPNKPMTSLPPTSRQTDHNIQNDMIAAANVKNGLALSTGCGPCHSFTANNIGKFGPNLVGIFGQKIARRTEYEYSDALKKHRGKFWNVHELNEWLTDPGEYAPGTKMAFAGVHDPQDRADLIAYLMTVK